jgi:hypothetical protein
MDMPILVVVKISPIVLQVVVLLSSVLMNGAEAYASRMLLLLESNQDKEGLQD